MGDISVEDMMTTLKQFYEDILAMNVMWDFSQASGVPPSAKEIETIIEYIKQHSEKRFGGKSAVIPPQNISNELLKAIQDFAANKDLPILVKVFSSAEMAIPWFVDKG